MKDVRHSIFSVVAALVALSLFSCRADVESSQENVIGYDNAEQITAAVDALYTTGAPAFYGECSLSGIPAAAIGGYLSGFFEAEQGVESGLYDKCRSLSLNAVSSCTGEVWKQAYQAIGSCNGVINNVAQVSGLSTEQKYQLVAEARFFRAFNYFYLARSFGEVSLETGEPDTRASGLSGVYELIVSDLNKAIADLPDQSFADNGFRISRPAAQMLLSDVYLTMSGYPLQQDHYKQAADMAREVINGGIHSLTANGATPETSAYNVLRMQNDNRECVYSYKSSGGNADKSLSSLCLGKDAANWGVVKTRTANAYSPTQSFLDVYDPVDDLRIQERQLFHSFARYEKSGRTVIQTFSRMPYFWYDEETLFVSGAAQKDIVIYRYAELLLIAAEAIAMSEGVTAEAVGYLTAVRSRAYTNTDSESIQTQLAALDSDRFVAEIWTERLREFPLEMKIWPDIQRTRKYPATSSEIGNPVVFNDVVGSSNPDGVTFTERHLLLPIPNK